MLEYQQTQQSTESKYTFQKQATPIIQTTVSNPASIIQRAKINPKSLISADVLQLQRTIGNRAVGRLLSEIRSPSKAKQAPIQRQEIQKEELLQGVFEKKPKQSTCTSCSTASIQQKEENRTGMPDNLKSGVENLSGIDMSDVRVRFNSSKPAEIGALAYTQGTEIHVAPGQERHLPHEAWHVVQQAQGRVKPTMQLKDGVPINNEEGLEYEANVMGKVALIKDTRRTSVQKNTFLKRQTIQRKMGFEFEAGKNKVLGEDRKFVVYEDNQFSLEADTKEDVEFVTKPFDKKSRLLSAVAAAANCAKHIATNKNRKNKYQFIKGGNVKNNATIEVNDDEFKASVQSTEGVKLEDLGELIREHIGGQLANWSEDDADMVLQGNDIGLTNEAENKIHGLIQYIALYVRQVKDRCDDDLKSQDGPKAYFRLMARTDFNSMFRSIIPLLGRTRGEVSNNISKLKNLVKTKLPEELEGDFTLDDYVFARGSYYESGVGTEKDGRNRSDGPKLGDWIDSIFTLEEIKDQMSPPLGYAAHNELDVKDRYGMGAYGMDDDKVLVEMRGHRSKLKGTNSYGEVKGKLPYTEWTNFARDIFDSARLRNDSLKNE